MRKSISIAGFSSASESLRCTPEGCKRFLDRYLNRSHSNLKTNGIKISKLGFGSPWIGSPKVQSNRLSSIIQNGCNFIELCENNKGPPDRPHADIDHWEMEAIVKLMIEEKVQRDELMLFSRIPMDQSPTLNGSQSLDSLNPERVRLIAHEALDFHALECLDGLVVEVPQMPEGEDSKSWQQTLEDAIPPTVTALESLVRDGMIQTYGFYSNAPGGLEENVFKQLSSLDAPSMGLVMFPMSPDRLGQLDQSKIALAKNLDLLVIGDECLHSKRADGCPVTFIDVHPDVETLHTRVEDVFNKALHMETEYMSKFLQKKDELEVEELPDAVEICWGHILSQKQNDIKSLEEWLVARELQVIPTLNKSFEILKDKGNQSTFDFGTLYKIVAFDLLETFTEMLEVSKAQEVEELIVQLDTLAPHLADLPSLSARALGLALSSGADCVLGEDLGIKLSPKISSEGATTNNNFQFQQVIPQQELLNISQRFKPW